MSRLTIVIGSKRLSSWSLRGWLALKLSGARFDEVVIPLDQPSTRQRILEHSPAGRVPILKDGAVSVWESLAICEYLAERFPEAGLWPEGAEARAHARVVAAEMHAGFAALRRDMAMDCPARRPGQGQTPGALADIARVSEIWRDCRRRFGSGGDFLFGRPGAADAMYAPVVSRFVTYDVPLDEVSAAYRDAVLALPAMREWLAAAH
ncbi:MAG: glutathione S-transferase family protein [Alphaproteobacteria bacterium]|nr:glutathione S-transferase family protein [Alphaproteobacteria bacterium]